MVSATLLCALMLSGCVGSDGSATAEPVPSPATSPAPPPANKVGVATILGASTVGEVLTADLQDPDGLQNATLTYQWISGGLNIADATSNTYTLTDNDIGAAIQVRISYTDDASFSDNLLSVPTAAVADLPNSAGIARITGVARVGQTLNAAVSDADGTTTSTLAYQWQADGVDIVSAEASGLQLTTEQVGAAIRARVTYTDDKGANEDVVSVETTPVVAAANGGGNFDRGTVGSNDSVPEVSCDTVTTSTLSLELLTSRSMTPGVTICLADGDYTDLDLDFGGTGTAQAPITVAAQNAGQVTIGGELSIRMSGTYVILQGLIFKDGTSTDGDLLQTRSGSQNPCHHCRVTEISIIDVDSATSDSNKWVSIYGQHTRVDHSWFSGKTNEGALLVVWRNVDDGQDPADTEIDYAQIDHNYFANRPPADGKPYPTSGDNGYEAVRIGTSDSHSADSLSVLEHNYFERIDGESEVISNKSGGNTIFNNTIRDSFGSLTLRHGSSANVSHNFILGDDHPFAAGIRVIDDGHRIVNNYIQGVRYTTTSFHGGIVLHASDGSTSNGYQILENVFVAHNTIVDSINSLSVFGGPGTIGPEDVTFVNNIIAQAIGPIIVKADEGMPSNSTYAGNYVFGEEFSDNSAITSFEGFNVIDAQLQQDGLGVARGSINSPALLADTGFNLGNFEPVVDDMDGQLRVGATDSGADHQSIDPVTIGLLSPLDVGPMNYTPPATPGTVVRFEIMNHDFDTGTDNWVFDAPAALTTTAGEVYSRNISAEVAGGGRIAQTVTIEPNTHYTLSAFTRGPARLGVSLSGVEHSQTENHSKYKFTQLSFSASGDTAVTIFAQTTGSEAFFDSFRLISHATAGSNP